MWNKFLLFAIHLKQNVLNQSLLMIVFIKNDSFVFCSFIYTLQWSIYFRYFYHRWMCILLYRKMIRSNWAWVRINLSKSKFFSSKTSNETIVVSFNQLVNIKNGWIWPWREYLISCLSSLADKINLDRKKIVLFLLPIGNLMSTKWKSHFWTLVF
jgi:hypothetical protein